MAAENTLSSPAERRRRKKEKKKVIEISLWIDGVKYEHGILCTFCAKIPACFHCSQCPDFYCESCDRTVHSHKKRREHVRSKISKYNLEQASRLVTKAVRYHGHLRTLQGECRKYYKRHFDRKTLCYYYFNTKYKYTTWRKPYCLRKEELFPFPTKEQAATRMQTLYRLWMARYRTIQLLKEKYVKIFDRSSGRFYYGFKGQSKLIPSSSWVRPRYCKRRAFPKDIMPIFTVDVACVLIQRKWRAFLMKKFLWNLCRATYVDDFDPIAGKPVYRHLGTGDILFAKPRILGKQPWDPNFVPDWDMDRVLIFLRRIGLKKYLKRFTEYCVDGITLCQLTLEDFDNMKITNKVHIRKIQVELAKIFKGNLNDLILGEDLVLRREKIRKSKLFHKAATLVQATFRGYACRKMLLFENEVQGVQMRERKRIEMIEANKEWWLERNLPHLLPPIKEFGRKRDFLGTRGWGHWNNGEWTKTVDKFTGGPDDAQTQVVKRAVSNKKSVIASLKVQFVSEREKLPKLIKKEIFKEGNVTRLFTEKLQRTNYDGRRLQGFNNEPIDLYTPQPVDPAFQII